MKMILVVYNVSIEEDVKALLNRNGALCFTQWPRLVGSGKTTGTRLDDNIWPGANGALFSVVEDAQAAGLMEAVETLRKGSARREGLKAFLLNVEASTGEL